MGKDELSAKEIAFVGAYEGRGSGAKAAAAAGYRYPDKMASKLLGRARVVKAIEAKEAAAREAAAQLAEPVTRADLMAFWRDMMNSPRAGKMARLKASEYLAKAMGVWREDEKERVPASVVVFRT